MPFTHPENSARVGFRQRLSAPELTEALGGKWRGRQGWAPCPAHAEQTPSLSIRAGFTAPLVHCFGGCRRDDVLAAIRDQGLQLGVAEEKRKSVEPPKAKQRNPETLSRLWRTSLTIEASDPAGQYLAARGCALPHPESDLRWHPNLWHPNGHRGPGLVALVTDSRDSSRKLSLHRTWIAADGSGRKAFDHIPKADRPPARLTLTDFPLGLGYVVRLTPDNHVTMGLGIAEGIESALAIAARGFRPVWACINVAGVASFPVLAGIDALTIAVDHDSSGAGQRAAAECAARWREAGREVEFIIPAETSADAANSTDLRTSKTGLLPQFSAVGEE